MPTYTFPFSSFATSGGGTSNWRNTGNAASQDGIFTTTLALVGGSTTTQYLQCTGPVGLSLPGNETVTGITFNVWRKSSFVSPGNTWIVDLHVYPIKGGTIQTSATDLADTVTLWPATNTAQTYGGNLLGLSWVNSDFGSGFGVAIDATIADPGFNGEQAFIDYVSCTLTTTVNGGGSGGGATGHGRNSRFGLDGGLTIIGGPEFFVEVR